MKCLSFFALLCWFVQVQAQTEEAELEKRLFNLPDVAFKKVSKPGDKYLKYLLSVKQPLDHQHLEKGFFYQSALLTHKGFSKPLVMETEGYELRYGGNEIERLLDANDINIEHRYFGTSRPDSLQWDYLTFEEVTADLHHINQLLRPLYNGKWVSTGISRGGMLAIYYKYFYPTDVDLTIPYVAPLTNSLEDKRIYHFLDTIGTADCRAKIFNVQKFLLEHADEAINKLMWYAKGKKMTFDHFSNLGKAFEYSVLEYPFAFWQLGFVPCENIPTNGSVDDYLEHILSVGSVEYFSDKYINQWAANGYMAKTQTGFYGYDLTRFKRQLRYVKGQNPIAALVPTSVPSKPFDCSFSNKIDTWLAKSGNNILYIYGSRDTWSACRAVVSSQINSKVFLLPNANHFEARVKNMPPTMQTEFAESISNLLGIQADLNSLKQN